MGIIQGKRYRYVMEIELPPAMTLRMPGAEGAIQIEGYVRSAVAWNDAMLPFLRGARVEVETQVGSGQFVPLTKIKE